MNVRPDCHRHARPMSRLVRCVTAASAALSLAATPPSTPAASDDGASFRDSTMSPGAMECPDKIVYPAEAARAGTDGVTWLLAYEDENGAVRVVIVGPSGPDRAHQRLDDWAVVALGRCRFGHGPARRAFVVYDWLLISSASPIMNWLLNLTRSEGERQEEAARQAAVRGNHEPRFALAQKAARDGEVRAQVQVGRAYLEGGQGAPKDPEEGILWLQKASDQGAADATYTLAMLALLHIGAQATHERYLELMTLAAERGLPQAAAMLGSDYEDGVLAPKDLKRALDWNRRAAEGGISWANLRIGRAYEEGLGVDADPAQAFVNYMIAAQDKVPGAREAADALAPRLSSEERERARRQLSTSGITLPP